MQWYLPGVLPSAPKRLFSTLRSRRTLESERYICRNVARLNAVQLVLPDASASRVYHGRLRDSKAVQEQQIVDANVGTLHTVLNARFSRRICDA
jgi:hypothetical protein